MMNILLSSVGRRVSLVRAFRRELELLQPSALVIGSDVRPDLSAACQVADRSFAVPRATDPDFVDGLMALCLAQHVSLVVPTIDTELLVLAENRQRFAEVGINLSISNPELVSKCRDKRLTATLFGQCGIRTPTIMKREALEFPLFVKPYDGSLSKDTFALFHPSELNERHLANEKLIFMEYIDPAHYDEYTVDMYYTPEHRLACAVPRLRMEIRAGEISKGRTSKGPLLSFLKERMATLEGARGCLTAQFFVNRRSGEAIGIEINPRFGGGYPLSYRAGANYPGWLISEQMGSASRPYWEAWEDRLTMLRYDDEIIVHAPRSH